MEFLLQNFPRDMIVFIRRVLFLALTTGLFIVLPLTYQVWVQWDSTAGYDEKLRWWIVLRLFVFCTQLPLRWTILDQLSRAETAPDDIALRTLLFQMTNQPSWEWSQYLSVFICSWVFISFVVCGLVLPKTQLVTVLWWICWWTVGLIGFHLACAVYLLHQMLGFQQDIADPIAAENSGMTSEELEPFSEIVSYTPWGSDEKTSNATRETCYFCFCEYDDGDKLRKFHNCSHYFHQKCIDRWMRTHNKCPYCTQRVDQECKIPATDSGDADVHNEDNLLRLDNLQAQLPTPRVGDNNEHLKLD